VVSSRMAYMVLFNSINMSTYNLFQAFRINFTLILCKKVKLILNA